MSPRIALLVCCGFIVWLFREDMKWRRLESKALWIAGIWVAIAGSRSPTYWMSYLGLSGAPGSDVEGSPVNFVITAALIVAGLLVLRQRGLSVSSFVHGNKALFVIYCFFALSALWSQYPAVSLRRLFKDFGCVPIALLLLSQRDPGAAIRAVYMRVSFILFPLSEVLYKYFPDIGRSYSKSGEPLFAGVCTFKNELGQTLMVFMLILFWDLFELCREEKSPIKRRQVLIHCGWLVIAFWLLMQAHSGTSLVCLLLGLLVWWGGAYLARLKSPIQVFLSMLAIGLCLVVLQSTFQLSKIGLDALGRDPTLTGRTENWPVMAELCNDPIWGTGYRMFWDVKGEEVERRTGFAYPSAHNGYLETYLAGGFVGLGLLALFLLAIFLKTAEGILAGGNFPRLGLSFWAVLLAYNWTESSFLWGSILWFTFLLWAVKPRTRLPIEVVLVSMNSGRSLTERAEAAHVS